MSFNCIDCEKPISRKGVLRCRKCRGEAERGSNSPSFKTGRYTRDNICIREKCENKVSQAGRRCRSCRAIEDQMGANNQMWRGGVTAHRRGGPKPLCPSCNKPFGGRGSKCSACIGLDQQGDNNPNWSGGKVLVNRQGYLQRSGGRLLHRETWAEANGVIPHGYEVHHKNHDKLDNRLENLELVTAEEHKILHKYRGGMTAEERKKRKAELQRGYRESAKQEIAELKRRLAELESNTNA